MSRSSSTALIPVIVLGACVDAPPRLVGEGLPLANGQWVRSVAGPDTSESERDIFWDCTIFGERVVAVGGAGPGRTFFGEVDVPGSVDPQAAGADGFVVFYGLADGAREISKGAIYGGPETDLFEAVVASEQQVFVGGRFNKTLLLGGTMVEGGSDQVPNGVVFAVDDTGEVLWAHGVVSQQRTLVRALDLQGNRLVAAGRIAGDVTDFGGAMLEHADENLEDVFFANLPTDGSAPQSLFARHVSGNDDARAVAVRSVDGRVLLAGNANLLPFEPDIEPMHDLFVLADSPTEFTPMTPGLSVALDLAVDDQRACVAGRFNGAVDFGSGAVDAAGSSDGYVSCRDDDLEELWTEVVGDARFDGLAMAGDLLVAVGSHTGDIEVAGDVVATADGSERGLVMLFELSTGAVLDAISLPGLAADSLMVRGIDLQGERLCIAGQFAGEFSGSHGGASSTTGSDDHDGFLWLGRVNLPEPLP